MKRTIKTSVAGFSFNLDEDAFKLLSDYLDSLKEYFEKKDGGIEIIEDIESRMSELLQMRLSSANGIINIDNAEEIIHIMGTPKDFEDGQVEGSKSEDKEPNLTQDKGAKNFWQKRLYRDSEQKVIAGICSGVGSYFRIDPVFIRVALLFLFFGSVFFGSIPFIHKWSGSIFLAYLILWIAVPEAKTMTQKLEMRGQDPTIANIETRTDKYTPNTNLRGQTIAERLAKIIVALIAGLFILIGILLIIVIVTSIYCYYFQCFSPVSIQDFLSTLGFSYLYIIIPILISAASITFFFLYAGIHLTRFNKHHLKVLMLTSGVWIASGIYITSMSIREGSKYRHSVVADDILPVRSKSDTLYLGMPQNYTAANTFIMDNDYQRIGMTADRSWFVSPKITITEDSTLTNYQIMIEKKAFDRHTIEAETRATQTRLMYTVKDSLILISPPLYNKSHPWDRLLFTLNIRTPKGKKVILKIPDGSTYFQDFWWSVD